MKKKIEEWQMKDDPATDPALMGPAYDPATDPAFAPMGSAMDIIGGCQEY
jgi:hypothetical protein